MTWKEILICTKYQHISTTFASKSECSWKQIDWSSCHSCCPNWNAYTLWWSSHSSQLCWLHFLKTHYNAGPFIQWLLWIQKSMREKMMPSGMDTLLNLGNSACQSLLLVVMTFDSGSSTGDNSLVNYTLKYYWIFSYLEPKHTMSASTCNLCQPSQTISHYHSIYSMIPWTMDEQ